MFRLCVFSLLLAVPAVRAEKVEILRDSYGVPHIYAKTAAGAAYGAGYAQAEDRLEEMLKNYRKAAGTMSEVFGASWFLHDYRQRLWRHRAVAETNYSKLGRSQREIIEAFLAGVKQYMKERPEKIPSWAQQADRDLPPWLPVALGRYIIWGWPEGEVGADLQRGGIKVEPPAYRGSNQMTLAGSRTSLKVPYAVVDPHLSWYGEFRFYEMRIYGGELAVSGAAILGEPMPSLGHNRYLSIAMTTGGPDTSDVFEEEIRGNEYRFKDTWRPLSMRTEKIGVKVGDKVEQREVTIASTHHGPIVARKDGKGYAAAIPYAEAFQLQEQSWKMMTSKNLAEFKAAMTGLEYMAQNIMVATVDGDIYYVRNGRVPVRPQGCDTTRPQNGADGKCEWQGIHKFEDLLQVTNPKSGYMENNNAPPEFLFKNMAASEPAHPENWKSRSYLYNDPRREPHQRAAATLEELDAARNVTPEQMMRFAFSTYVHLADRWQARLKSMGAAGPVAADILAWNGRSDADSRGALAFYAFKMMLGGEVARATVPPQGLTDEAIKGALQKAEAMLAKFPPKAVFGDYFRVGREGSDRTWPVGGGSLAEAGMATPRAVNFQRGETRRIGISGQTSTQIVVLTKPPRSWMVIPLGESDDPKSGHFEDQAEKLFSKGTAKPTHFLRRKELEKELSGRVTLEFPARR